jgi:hypothetical protein
MRIQLVPLFILFLFLAGCTGSVSPAQETGPYSSVFAECQDKSQSAQMMDVYKIKEDCLIKKAMSVEQCQSYKGKLIYQYGSIKNYFEQDSVDGCIYALALSTNNEELCGQTGKRSQNCYNTLAVQKKSPPICTHSQQPNNCYLFYISGLGIDTECQKPTPGGASFISILSCFFEQAEKAGLTTQQLDGVRMEVCELYSANLENIGNKENICTAAFGAYTKDTALCDSAGNYKGDCYRTLASNSPQMTLKDCDKAGIDYFACYIAIAVRTQDASICNQVPVAHKSDCITQVSVKLGDLSLCLQLGAGTREAVSCAVEVIRPIPRDNWTYEFCDAASKFENSVGVNLNTCFYEVGLKTLNLKSCQRITGDDAAKDDCATRVGHALKNR